MVFNLKNILPGAMAVAGAFLATAANAQNVISPSTGTFPNASIGGVSVTGSVSSLDSLPFALPTIGNTINFQITGSPLLNFTNLPTTGNGVSSNFTIVLNLTLTGPQNQVLNFTGSNYSYNADATNNVSPFNAGTAVGVSPGGPQNFGYLGGTYQVTLNNATAFTGGDPTNIAISTITGTIRNTTQTGDAPEPGTLILAGLGIAGLAARRRRKN